MRFEKVWIDGYGKFTDRDVELSLGLQVIAGPNEQGKSTLRHFLEDMLYGQKKESVRTLYEEANELRTPWDRRNGYGGRLVYVLDSGETIEVRRSFDRDDESVQVFDLTHGEDITGEFPVLRNRESTFAEEHLKMTKPVFLSIATISHLTLSGLGDQQALARIREKLLSLADSGIEDSSAEKAIARLNERIEAIGRSSARTKPLPAARTRVTELRAEHAQLCQLQHEISELAQQRHDLLEEVAAMKDRRRGFEAQLRGLEARSKAELLRKAEALEGRIQDLDRRSFEHRAASKFPTDKVEDVRQLQALIDTAEKKATRTQIELDALRREIENELSRYELEGIPVMNEPDPEHESRLADLESEVHHLKESVEERTAVRDETKRKLEELEGQIEALPDFTTFKEDPIELLNRTVQRFEDAWRARDREQAALRRLGNVLNARRELLSPLQEAFGAVDDFPAWIEEFETKRDENEEVLEEIERSEQDFRRNASEVANRVPAFTIFALLGLGASVFFIIVAVLTGNWGIFGVAAFTGLTFTYFAVAAIWHRRRANFTMQKLGELEYEREGALMALTNEHKFLEELKERTGCETLREIEAAYERYEQFRKDVEALEDEQREQEGLVVDARKQTDETFEELKVLLDRFGQKVQSEDDIGAAATRAAGHHQQYRDAMFRLSETRDQLQRRNAELKDLETRLEQARDADVALSLEVRRFLRENNFNEEENYESALKALRAYRIRSAQMRQKRAAVDIQSGKLSVLQRQLAGDRSELQRLKNELKTILEEAGVPDVEAFFAGVREAQTYGELRKERNQVQDQLSMLLGDVSLNALRDQVGVSEPSEGSVEDVPEEIRREMEKISELISTLEKQAHALQLNITERSAGCRALNEVEEQLESEEERIRLLERELDAAAHAMSVIEEVARDRHARIAPRLAELASTYISEITGGLYREILIDPNLHISVRVPQTQALNSDPDRRLSKGTVDQVYFALRLALVQCVSERSERIPMVLDDPFANYDDARLARAMKLLATLGETNQILLFTCREDVIRAAQSANAAILHL